LQNDNNDPNQSFTLEQYKSISRLDVPDFILSMLTSNPQVFQIYPVIKILSNLSCGRGLEASKDVLTAFAKEYIGIPPSLIGTTYCKFFTWLGCFFGYHFINASNI
jgi:hypothetical protein